MNIKRNITNKKENMSIKNYDYYLFFILIIFLILKIFIFNTHYLEHDELVNFTTYQYFETILLKNYPNNHIFISVIGFLLEKIVGTNIVFFKFINFLFFILILYHAKKLFVNNIYLYLLLFIFISSEILFVYSFVLRGYYISAFLFVIIYEKLLNLEKNNKLNDLKIIYILCFLQLINNISSLYLVAPIIFSTIFNLRNFLFFKKTKVLVMYFLIPLLFINSFQFLITGAYLNKINLDFNFYIFIKEYNIFEIYSDGLKHIYFGPYTEEKLFNNLNNLIIQIKNNKIEFFILFLGIFISVKNILFKNKVLDKIIIYFAIFFLIINRFPPERIYISFLFFFIFYIFENIKLQNLFLKYGLLILSFVLILNIQNIYKNIPVLKNEQISIEKVFKCNLNVKGLKEIEKHLYYFLYLEKCKKNKNLMEFVLFYRS